MSSSDEDDTNYETAKEDKIDFTQSFGKPGQQNALKDFTFMGDREMPKQVHKKLGSIASIRDFLEDELGQERLYQAYPVLRDFGDDILFEEKSDDLVAKLGHILTKAEVKKY